MARFYGAIGYGETVETKPGVYKLVITERKYYGNVLSNTRRLEDTGEKVNDDITTGNSISIVADAYAHNHFFNIRYIRWAGVAWKVSNVDVQAPRLILRLGGVHNGPFAT